jgi:hypothetical protein
MQQQIFQNVSSSDTGGGLQAEKSEINGIGPEMAPLKKASANPLFYKIIFHKNQ